MKPGFNKLDQATFICLDCESTGLDPQKDHIIEVAGICFTLNEIKGEFNFLIDPGCNIPEESIHIHGITNEMVKGKPKIHDVLSEILNFIGKHPIVGHGVGFDIDLLHYAAQRTQLNCSLKSNPTVDTLRMARLYGQCPVNSLEQLRQHFNIPLEGAHRAMSDVIVNVEVFKNLLLDYNSLDHLFMTLSKPIAMKTMPLGKHKGRPFRDIPLEYLLWAARKDFDNDLLFSLRSEIKRRKNGNLFTQASNPFQAL